MAQVTINELLAQAKVSNDAAPVVLPQQPL